mmetsp:Transcript_24975/g.26068  ORF Transcript_24975/g.26068 Transcript_24975/m.26068 type:complete len:237 (+) Transcript_24975:1-711(+)
MAMTFQMRELNFNGLTECVYCGNRNIKINQIFKHSEKCRRRPVGKDYQVQSCIYNPYHLFLPSFVEAHENNCFYNNNNNSKNMKDNKQILEINAYIRKQKNKASQEESCFNMFSKDYPPKKTPFGIDSRKKKKQTNRIQSNNNQMNQILDKVEKDEDNFNMLNEDQMAYEDNLNNNFTLDEEHIESNSRGSNNINDNNEGLIEGINPIIEDERKDSEDPDILYDPNKEEDELNDIY